MLFANQMEVFVFVTFVLFIQVKPDKEVCVEELSTLKSEGPWPSFPKIAGKRHCSGHRDSSARAGLGPLVKQICNKHGVSGRSVVWYKKCFFFLSFTLR